MELETLATLLISAGAALTGPVRRYMFRKVDEIFDRYTPVSKYEGGILERWRYARKLRDITTSSGLLDAVGMDISAIDLDRAIDIIDLTIYDHPADPEMIEDEYLSEAASALETMGHEYTRFMGNHAVDTETRRKRLWSSWAVRRFVSKDYNGLGVSDFYAMIDGGKGNGN